MPVNLTKRYPQLLELLHLTAADRADSLRAVFSRDIENNNKFQFLHKFIHPIKKDDGQSAMDTLFQHLTHVLEEVVDENGRSHKSRKVFEMDRSRRIHWIKHLVEMNYKSGIEIFSIIERDHKQRKDVQRTYLYDLKQKYVIVFEPQRSMRDYYLLSAYYLNRQYGEKKMKKKMKQKLQEVL